MVGKFRKHAMTIVVAVVAVLVVAGGMSGAHNRYKAGHVLFAHKAGRANKVTGFTRLPFKKVVPSATRTSQSAAQAAASKMQLFSKGPFKIYAKCFKEISDPSNPGVFGEIYLKTSVGGAVFSSEENGSSNGFLTPSTPEQERKLSIMFSYAGTDPGTLNITDAVDVNFYAAAQQTDLIGTLFVGTKVGSPIVGDGVFGAGDRCIFGGAVTSR